MRSLREGFEVFGIDPSKPKSEAERTPKTIDPIEHHSEPSATHAAIPQEDSEQPERIITTLNTVTITRVDSDAVAKAARLSLLAEQK